jgi:long-chain acyl-CoA synthetase
LADRLPSVQYFIPVDSEHESVTCDRTLAFNDALKIGADFIAEGNSHYTETVIDTEKCCAIIFTSGTTGTSKGVMLCQKNLCSNATSAAIAINFIKPGTRLVSVLPMNHTYEVTCSHLTAQYYGASTFLNDSLKYVLRNFQKFKPEILVLVPLFVETMHKKIWAEIRAKGKEKLVRRMIKVSNALRKVGIDLRKKFFAQILNALGGELQGIVSGGAPLNPQLIKDFKDFGIDILEGYGISECSPLLAVNLVGKERLRSVGPAVHSVTVRIDKEKPEDETGEIVATGPNVMLGYYRNEEATKDVFTDDGWFRTGDIGYMDKDGYVYITGRKKNIIILSNGKNIFPEEIEEYLTKIEIIAESVIVGKNLPDSDEQVITALVYPDYEQLEGLTKEEIYEKVSVEIESINRELPQYKQIRQIIIRETEFEKTTSRKIKRYKL